MKSLSAEVVRICCCIVVASHSVWSRSNSKYTDNHELGIQIYPNGNLRNKWRKLGQNDLDINLKLVLSYSLGCSKCRDC